MIEALNEVSKQWDNAEARHLAGYARGRRDYKEPFFDVLEWFAGPTVKAMARIAPGRANGRVSMYAAPLIEAAKLFKERAKEYKEEQAALKQKANNKQNEDDEEMS